MQFVVKYSFGLLLILMWLVSCNKEDCKDEFLTNRTVIVYMAAENDLTDDAYTDIEEMQSGYVEKGANLVVFIDPADEAPHILKIGRGSSTMVKTYPEFNSADAEQMERILNDIIEMYPAASYGLVLWSHGTSWLPAGSRLKSFGNDNGSRMDITPLAASLPVRFNFILMDACLMGSVEVAYELRNKTDFILASSTETIYLGFPYERIIPELLRTEPDLRKAAASYFNYYDKMSGTYRSATITLIDTKELDRLAPVTAQLIADRVFDAGTFDRTSVQRLDVYNEQYAFDFLDFLKKAFPDADTEPLKEQLSKAVLYKAHTPRFIEEYDICTYCGLSCYIPHPQRGDLNTYYRQLDWCRNSGFYRLFQNTAIQMYNMPKNDYRMSEEPQNNETRQGETPNGATLPP